MDAVLPLPTFLTGPCLPIKTQPPKKIQDRIDDWFAIVETRKMEAKVILEIQNTYLGDLDQLVKCADRIPNKKGKWCKRCRGGDFLAVMRYGNIVRKFRELDRFREDKIDQLLGHNYLFGDKTPYRIEGWTIRKNFQGETGKLPSLFFNNHSSSSVQTLVPKPVVNCHKIWKVDLAVYPNSKTMGIGLSQKKDFD